MDEREFRRLIDKYLKGECTPEERTFLENSLDAVHESNRRPMDFDFKGEIQQRIWSKIQSETIALEAIELEPASLEQTKASPFSFLNIYKVAAVLAGIAIGSAGIWATFRGNNINKKEQLVYTDDQIILRSGSNAYEIQTKDFGQIHNDKGEAIASQKGDVIVFSQSSAVKELIYNEIEVPRGKRIQLILSDGTTVHLNSNSIFKFPVNFLPGKDRQVSLTGEAYFEVAKDKSRPFFVDVNEMRVSVLGTHFNVSSYAGSISNTVLLEGSVTIQERYGAGDEVQLVPGQKASLIAGIVEIKEVDVDNYIGWMNGTLVFDNEPFSEIVKKIERRYNVKVEVDDEDLAWLRFKGKFQEESIIDLLDTFKESAGFNYEISDNKVIINNKGIVN